MFVRIEVIIRKLIHYTAGFQKGKRATCVVFDQMSFLRN